MLDPIADKLLISSALMMLVYMDDIRGLRDHSGADHPGARDSGVRACASSWRRSRCTCRCRRIAKFKTAVQVVALAVLIVAPAVEHVWGGLHRVGIIALWGAAVLTHLHRLYLCAGQPGACVGAEHARPRRKPRRSRSACREAALFRVGAAEGRARRRGRRSCRAR